MVSELWEGRQSAWSGSEQIPSDTGACPMLSVQQLGERNDRRTDLRAPRGGLQLKQSEEGRCGSAFGQRGFGGQSWGCLGGREGAECEGERVEGVRSTEERRERKESNSERRWGDNWLTTTTYTMVYILQRHEVTM